MPIHGWLPMTVTFSPPEHNGRCATLRNRNSQAPTA
jgi:hypothetical protein